MADAAILSIRRAVRGDVEALLSLRALLLDGGPASSYASRNAEEGRNWKAAYRHWLRRTLGSDGRARIVVAVCGEAVVACATGIVDTRPPAPDCLGDRCGWVQSVVVAAKWRRQGVAERLLRALLQWFETRGVAKVVLESTPVALPLYRKLGFAPSHEPLLIRGRR
ncbi:MAG: GNAT family N-acetyltransferase [Pelomonas sp.]|nr:GNAT family N-acetyltransferase [Roseateles sp.]